MIDSFDIANRWRAVCERCRCDAGRNAGRRSECGRHADVWRREERTDVWRGDRLLSAAHSRATWPHGTARRLPLHPKAGDASTFVLYLFVVIFFCIAERGACALVFLTIRVVDVKTAVLEVALRRARSSRRTSASACGRRTRRTPMRWPPISAPNSPNCRNSSESRGPIQVIKTIDR
jgi:hypothetical protein